MSEPIRWCFKHNHEPIGRRCYAQTMHGRCDIDVMTPIRGTIDYEAAAEVLQSDESMTSWLMWATTIVDAAVGEDET